MVRNRAQLTYSAVGPWLEGTGAAREGGGIGALQAQLRLQNEAAHALRRRATAWAR